MGRKNRRRGHSGHRQMHLRLAGGAGYATSPSPASSFGREERRRQAQLLYQAFHRTEVEWPDDPCPYPEDYQPSAEP